MAAAISLSVVSPAAAQREADLCVVPPGAQPMLPAKLLEAMGVTDMPVTTSSEEARRFFNQYTEPPAYPRPVVEGWASVAQSLGDYVVADAAWREALDREPGGGRAYFGRAAALQGLGRADDARTVRDRAARAWARADSDLPQLRQFAAPGSARAQ